MYTSSVTGKPCMVLNVPEERCIDPGDEPVAAGLKIEINATTISTFQIERTYSKIPELNPFI